MAAATSQILGDAAYSNLYGVRLAEKGKTVSNIASFGALTANSLNVVTLSANSINGSAANVGLANALANQLLATDSNIDFISIAYTIAATPNSVPIRVSTDFTAFTQLFLTNTSNQIVANLSGQQVTLNVPTPAASRVQNLNIVPIIPGIFSALAVTGSATGTTSFQDPTQVNVQLGLGASGSGRAGVVLDSASGSDAVMRLQLAQIPLWSFGLSGGNFVIRNDSLSVINVKATALSGPTRVAFQTSGDLVPTAGSTLTLGSATNHWNAIGLAPGVSTGTNTFAGPINALTNSAQTVINTLVTATSVVICAVLDFTGTYVTQGTPYTFVSNISANSFVLNVFNVDNTNNIPIGVNTVVQWWILP